MLPTVETLLETLSEFDAIGREAFLEKYTDGVGSRTYFIVFGGRRYDLKAVWAAAHRPPKRLRTYHPEGVARRLASNDYAAIGIEVAHTEASAENYQEGQRRRRVIEYIERNPLVVRDARRKYGSQCMVCGFDFDEVYGTIANSFIECHHTRPLARTGSVLQDLKYIAVLCSNCHKMVHKNDPPFSVKELKHIVAHTRGA